MEAEQPNPLNYQHLGDVDRCPSCGSDNVRRLDPCEREPDMTETDCECLHCGFTWQDVFEKVPYYIGRSIDGELLQAPPQIIEQAAREHAGELAAVLAETLAALEKHGDHTVRETCIRLNRLIELITKGVVQHGT